MSRLEQTRQVYSLALERLYENEQHFANFLRYAGRFYKLPFLHTSTLFHLNPEATMWADYDTWAAFGNNVLRGQRSTPALLGGNSRLKHYFDISRTTQAVTPFQWTMDKNVAQEFLSTAEKAENKQYKSIASYINRHVEQLSEEMAEDIFSAFSVPEQDKKAFLNSFCTMAETVVAARCEHNSSYKYKAQGVPDLSALQMLKSPEELERLCGFIQTSAKTVLLDMEKSITKIINLQRSEQNERSKELSEGERETGNDLVRGGSEVLSEVRSGREAGDSISAGHGDMDVQPPLGADNGRTGEGAAETADNALRSEVEGVHGGKSLLGDTSPYGQLTLGDNTEGDRQRSAGDVSDIGGAVRSSQSQTDRVYGNGEVGEDEAVGDRPYDNDGIGTPVSGIIEQDTEAAEISEEVSAASVFEDEEDVSFHSKLQPIAYDYINNNKPYYDVPEERNELLKISYALRNHRKEIAAYFAEHENSENRSNYIKKFFDNTYSELILQSGQRVGYRAYDDFLSIWRGSYPSREQEAFITWDKVADYISEIPLDYWLDEKRVSYRKYPILTY